MSWTSVADLAALVCLALGSFLCLCAAIGLVRFPDLLSRMHAATKPQTLGILLVLLGVGIGRHSPLDIGMLLLVAIFQMASAPVSSHLLSRAAIRTGQVPGVRDDERVDRP
ncbi:MULTISPECIES: monovalent cation/H(+) antiporter subunit G [Arsenicicoccus]|uniref:Monovalent cation/H(+) antiporter subunit G n=1 Tax=Arsenicicoccus bolidensis TaxID=229480 RepID=A0ABS9Q2Z0_9MICO|nr:MULTISPECIES: monovalent cation/H(+) antiporter subunit G [Arsenicicoccus]MCG7321687.1 monovalent cation/H(+) antiporter subunit G [Arsenicicoccus bolidensis]